MSFEPFVLPELVRLAQSIRESEGDRALEDFRSRASWCGCMGPRPGDHLCGCDQVRTLESNLVEVVNEIDPNLSRRIMLRRLVAALPG